MLRVLSPYNVREMVNVSAGQGSLDSLAMNALLATNVTNVLQNFMDTQIVKVS